MSSNVDNSTRVTTRVSEAIVERVDDLIPFIATRPEYSPSGAVSRSDALRLALLKGLIVLEQEREELEANPKK